MHTVIETPAFLKAAADAGLTDAERKAIVDIVAFSPEHGAVMRGTGGLRKFRVGRRGAGKSGGYRVISFFSGAGVPVFLITLFSKGEKDNLTKAECNALKQLADTLVDGYRNTG